MQPVHSLPETLECPVTGVGSLPFKLAEEAIRCVIETTPEIPYWPQLPCRTQAEGMIQQFLGPARPFLAARERQAGYAITSRDEFLYALAGSSALDEHHASGFFALVAALKSGRFPRARALKGQVTGPWTLATTLFSGSSIATADEALFESIVRHVAHNARWQVEQLAAFGMPVILQVDEPGFLSVRDPDVIMRARGALVRVLDAIRSAGGIPLVHCCARPLRAQFEGLATTLALDAGSFGTECAVLAHEESLPGFALGLAPVHAKDDTNAGGIVASFRAAFGPLADATASRSLITPACGLALATPAETRRSFALAAEVARELSAGRQLGSWR